MKIQLLTHIEKLGNKGDIVDVSAGYAKNALILKKKARVATPDMIAQYEAKQQEKKKEHDQKADHVHELIKKLKKESFTFTLKGGSGGEVFTSLHEEEVQKKIASYLSSQDTSFGEKDVHIHMKPIKELGVHEIPLRIGREDYIIPTTITITIEKE